MGVAWPDLIDGLLAGEDLPADQAQSALGEIMRGEIDPAVIGAFLIALRAKGETAVELSGLAQAMRDHALAIPDSASLAQAVDIVGTGGDRAGTVNVSTMASLVCAGAGVPVAKHGNRAASSQCGTADVLEALGVTIAVPPEGVIACLEEAGIAFMFAPAFHPALKHVMPVRRALGVRTTFNVLGPLANPAGVRRMVLGVPTPKLGATMAEALAVLGTDRALVVNGDGGLDELVTTGPNLVWELTSGMIQDWELEPKGLGFERAVLADIRGGDPTVNADVVRRLLDGEAGAVRDTVVLNAAAGLVAGGVVDKIADGIEPAQESIDSGAAKARLAALVEVSARYAASLQ